MAKTVFYSFHYDNDVHRVQLVRNINALDPQPLLNSQEWEQVKQGGDAAIEKWINDEMAYKRAVVVLIGKRTAGRKWVNYEIDRAWSNRRPLLGVRIHGLSSLGTVDSAGGNPFANTDADGYAPIFDPTVLDIYGKIDSKATYNNLRENLVRWTDQGATR